MCSTVSSGLRLQLLPLIVGWFLMSLAVFSCRLHRLPTPSTFYYFCVFWSGPPVCMPPAFLKRHWPLPCSDQPWAFVILLSPPAAATARLLPFLCDAFPHCFLPIFSFNDSPQFVPIGEVRDDMPCEWEKRQRAFLWGALSLSLFCSVCVCVSCVCSGEMGHRGGGRLAGTAESGGVQRHLHPTRHPRFGAAAPGEEGPEGKHTPVNTPQSLSKSVWTTSPPPKPAVDSFSVSSWNC